jgi:hypothetical protein
MRKSKKSQVVLFASENESQETSNAPQGEIASEDYFREISNSDLIETDLPPPHSKWGDISRFAMKFNGYTHWGFDKCAAIANKSVDEFGKKKILPKSLTELRTCLFFEQRRYRHSGFDPDKKEMTYIYKLVEAIREKVRYRIFD